MDEYHTGALAAWTPAQQAALRAMQASQQAEQDVDNDAKDERDLKKWRALAEAETRGPPSISPGSWFDERLKTWSPPIHSFTDLFGAPHIVLPALLALHALFLYAVPWYYRFLAPYFLIYLLPAFSTVRALGDPTERQLWLSYWLVLCPADFLEPFLFHDRARVLVWWPAVGARRECRLTVQLKAVACVLGYSMSGSVDGQSAYGVVAVLAPLQG